MADVYHPGMTPPPPVMSLGQQQLLQIASCFFPIIAQHGLLYSKQARMDAPTEEYGNGGGSASTNQPEARNEPE